MFTFVAWHRAVAGKPPRVDHVERLLGLDPETGRGIRADGDRHGLYVWDDTTGFRYPPFVISDGHAVATLGLPTGVSHLVGTGGGPAESLPVRLARGLRTSDELMTLIAPPFALIDCHRSKGLRIYTDGLGMARVYQADSGGLRAWSNRPAALAAIGAAVCEEDEEAWSAFAACGWFTEMRTPFAGVSRLGPGSVIETSADGSVRRRSTGALSVWATTGLRPDSYEAAASAMVTYVADVTALTTGSVVSMLSGGRDSRAVSAAVIGSGVPATFVTIGPLHGEVETARRLLELAGRQAAHEIREPRPPGDREELTQRIRALHTSFDGDLTPVKMNSPVTGKTSGTVHFGGAGGEIAHANYYATTSRLEQLQSGGRGAPARRLQRYFRSMPGATPEGYRRVDAVVERWTAMAEELGIHGPSTLDFFYLMERFRRWAPAANTPGSFPPFATPAFMSAALGMRPVDRVEGRLHTSIIRSLIPRWVEVPFYKASAEDSSAKSARRLRIWQGKDAVSMEQILDSPTDWDDVFDAATVRDLWRTATSDGLPNRMEAIFQRVAWRAVFRDHITDLQRRLARLDTFRHTR